MPGSKPTDSEILNSEMQLIAEGRHPNAFAVLGPHEFDGAWQIRAWLPHAEEAYVIIGPMGHEHDAGPMMRALDGGFFIAELEHKPLNYHIQINLYSGQSLDFEDPYRFPPLL